MDRFFEVGESQRLKKIKKNYEETDSLRIVIDEIQQIMFIYTQQ